MRTLTNTLLAAQQAESRAPCVRVQARNDPLGVPSLRWERLYSGTETDGLHGAALTGDGSLIRVRVASADDNYKVYWQRVPNPCPTSDFSQWTYLNVYNALNATVCSLNSEVNLFWVAHYGQICSLKSLDNGASWGPLEYPGLSPNNLVNGMSVACRPNGDLFLFFAAGNCLYLIKRLNGAWQPRLAWDKSTGLLFGVAAVHDGDWKLLISGEDIQDNQRLWSLVYGDGQEIEAGNWSELKAVLTAPSDSGYQFGPVFMDKPDVLRCFCNEKYSGDEAYSRPLTANAIPGASFLQNLWTEPKPFNFLNNGGLAMTHSSEYLWLTCPNSIWRAPLGVQTLDLSADLLSFKTDLTAAEGRTVLELRNDGGLYSSPGSGWLAVLQNGCRLDLSPGYRTAMGDEYCPGLSFILRGWEHLSDGRKNCLNLFASDGWDELKGWKARYPLRWNAAGDEASVKDILAFVLARAGLILEIRSQSFLIESFYPDFTIQPGEDGKSAVAKLLSLVADDLFIEGSLAYLHNPTPADASVYSYGAAHPILEGRYRRDVQAVNHIQVIGRNPSLQGGENGPPTITTESFSWRGMVQGGERLLTLEDLNLETKALGHQRGEIILRRKLVESQPAILRTALNCGQQLQDVIDITDPPAGLNSARKRVMGIQYLYCPARGQYQQTLSLGKALEIEDFFTLPG